MIEPERLTIRTWSISDYDCVGLLSHSTPVTLGCLMCSGGNPKSMPDVEVDASEGVCVWEGTVELRFKLGTSRCTPVVNAGVSGE